VTGWDGVSDCMDLIARGLLGAMDSGPLGRERELDKELALQEDAIVRAPWAVC